MNEEEILEKINQLKSRIKEIVQEIQSLKKQLEQASIPLEDFKSKKESLEQELRDILQQIAQVKESSDVKQEVEIKPESQITEEPQIEVSAGEIKDKIKEDTSQIIYKEILAAQEAKDLMYYFQTEFIDSITNANVYLSITVDDHFIIGIDFTNYPEKPKLKIPSKIIELFKEEEIEENKFKEKIPSYSNWDSENPKHIYELITEIEIVLINKYQADIETIEKKSVEYVEKTKKRIEELLQKAQEEINKKNLQKAIDIYYGIVDLSYDINDLQGVKKYTSKLNYLLKKQAKQDDDED